MLKDEVVAMDQGLFDKNGSQLSPGNSIYDDFNSTTINKLKCARSRHFSIYGSRAYSRVQAQAQAHSRVQAQAIYQQSSKEEAKQKEMYQFKTKVSQNGKCKSKGSAKTFT